MMTVRLDDLRIQLILCTSFSAWNANQTITTALLHSDTPQSALWPTSYKKDYDPWFLHVALLSPAGQPAWAHVLKTSFSLRGLILVPMTHQPVPSWYFLEFCLRWTLEHSLQFFSLGTSVGMISIIWSAACSALLRMLLVQAHRSNTTLSLRGQLRASLHLLEGLTCAFLGPKTLRVLHFHWLAVPQITSAACSRSLPCVQEPHQPILCFKDQPQILLESMKGKSPLLHIHHPPSKWYISYGLGTFQNDWEQNTHSVQENLLFLCVVLSSLSILLIMKQYVTGIALKIQILFFHNQNGTEQGLSSILTISYSKKYSLYLM